MSMERFIQTAVWNEMQDSNGLLLASSSLSMQFNPTGGSRQRIEGPTDTTILGANLDDFTVSLWFEVDVALAQFHGPIGSAPNSSFQDGWGLYRDTSDNVVNIYIDAYNTSSYNFTETGFWTASGWHHIVFTYDKSEGQVIAWTDGNKHDSGSSAVTTNPGAGGAHTIGSSHVGGGTFGDFTGKVDVAAFWAGHVCTDDEAATLYNGGVPGVPTEAIANPDWYLLFGEDASDDATPTTGQVTDQTANNNDFTPLAADNDPAMNFNEDTP